MSAPAGEPLAHLPDSVCAPSATPAELTAFFDGGTPMIGADYQRAYPLPDGRVLWLFQDAFLPTSHGHQLVHNVGLLQSGECFQLLRNGSANAPTSYLFADRTDRYDHWFWPLGGEIGDDGNLHVFVAEMVEHSGGYLRHTEPIATWLATMRCTDSAAAVGRRPAHTAHTADTADTVADMVDGSSNRPPWSRTSLARCTKTVRRGRRAHPSCSGLAAQRMRSTVRYVNVPNPP